MRALLWMLLAMAGTALAQSADQAQIDVGGKLIAPPCTQRFASSQQVELGNVNLNQLVDDSAVVTEVPLVFDCRAGTQVDLVLSAGMGSSGNSVLLTDRKALGLSMQLRDKTEQPSTGLGDARSWTVGDGPLQLSLLVKPVSVGELPEAGSYRATLLMHMTYR